MAKAEKPRSLENLDVRLRAAREGQGRHPSRFRRQAAEQRGYRIAFEMVSTFVGGGLLGWGLDLLFGTAPWLMLTFFFLGAATGVVNAIRAARQMNRDLAQQDGATAPPEKE
jgi:ATP synthase protein I